MADLEKSSCFCSALIGNVGFCIINRFLLRLGCAVVRAYAWYRREKLFLLCFD